MQDDKKHHKKIPGRLTDDQIRSYLEATSFCGRCVSQADINRARRFLEVGIIHQYPQKARLIPGDYD